MTTDIIIINWYDTYGDQYLAYDYEQLEKIFAEHPKCKCLFDCATYGVFQYTEEASAALRKLEGGLFEPEYYSSVDDWIEEYYEHETYRPEVISHLGFFHEIEYQKRLLKIGRQCGDDDREFDRLWCEEFILDEDEFAYA